MSVKLRRMLQGKIHGATISSANLHYEGSIAIPASILDAAGILPSEAVWVWNVTNGNRFETYTIVTDEVGHIAVNGAAARLVQPNDKVIVAAFAQMDEQTARAHVPSVVFMNDDNSIKQIRAETLSNVV
jgi:aspartate 1-decarboxylase